MLTCVQRAIWKSGRQKEAPEHWCHSTGKLLLSFTHANSENRSKIQGLFFFLKEAAPSPCVSASWTHSVSFLLADELVRVERRFYHSVLTFFRGKQVCHSMKWSHFMPENLKCVRRKKQQSIGSVQSLWTVWSFENDKGYLLIMLFLSILCILW